MHFVLYMIAILLFIGIILLIIMRGHARNLVTQKYIFKNQKIKTDCKICFISDFHYLHFLPFNYYQNIIEKLNSAQPDIVIFGGDYLHRNNKPNSIEVRRLIQLFSKVDAPYKIAILGNHDKDNFSDEYWQALFAENNIQLLINTQLAIEEFGIEICGVDDFKKGNARVLEKYNLKKMQLLVTHNPDFMETLQNHHFDLILSGHLHGGQGTIGFKLYPALRLFKLTAYGNKYRYGNVGTNGYDHISTSGIGAHFGLRLGVYPEIVQIVIQQKREVI